MHRTVEIIWHPTSSAEWEAFTCVRKVCGQIWRDLVVRHFRIRRLGAHLGRIRWPTMSRLMTWVKQRYPLVHSQSAQQVVLEFLEAVNSTRQRRLLGYDQGSSRYPYRTPQYRDVTYTNQGVRLRDGFLILSNGKRTRPLRVKMPRKMTLPGRLMEVWLSFGKVRIACQLEDEVQPEPTVTIGIDLGVNTLIAAGDEQRAVLISGREAKATIQWREKRRASLSSAQASLTKGSRRWRRLQRRKLAVLDKAANRIKDITHKATHVVAVAFPNAKVIVGKPFNAAAEKLPRKQAQQVASASNAKIIAQLAYKLAGVTRVEEHYTSQTCPVCGERRRVRRVYECKSCGFKAPRDVVGLTNIRRIGIHGGMVPSPDVPRQVTYVLPIRKYPGETRRSKDCRSQVVPGEPRHVARRAA